MSGFAGVISLDGAPPDRDLLGRMADVLKFRGPDAINIVVQPGAGFVFTFLRTGPAPQCSSQPCTLDGRFWLIGDIRLDGRDGLRLRLEQHGDRFDAEPTDEELVLRAWRRWGEKALPDLIGDYAFTIWDSEARRLVCARDLIGGRPFFYARAKGWFYFSNTLNAIRCSRSISAELDPHFIGDLLLQGTCSYADRTVFRHILRLPAGSMLRLSAARIETHRFQSIPIDEPLWLKGESNYVERFRELLECAISDRLPKGNVAVYMSGGLDSTSIAALSLKVAQRNRIATKLRCYCVDCQPLFDDQEGRLAKQVAEHLGIPIHIWRHVAHLPFRGWPENGNGTPEPSMDPYLPFFREQQRSVAKHAQVVFTGYGGDGVLTGQTWPFVVDLVKDREIGRLFRCWVGYVVRKNRLPPLRGGFRSRFRSLFRPSSVMFNYPPWLSSEFEHTMHTHDRWRELHKPATNTQHRWYPDVYSLWENGYWSRVLELEDAEWTRAAVETRSPFLDIRVLRFLLCVPPVPLCVDKELLRIAMRDLLPEAILGRPKTPLAGDQLHVQASRGMWSPLPLPDPSPAATNFVDWQGLEGSLQQISSRFLCRDMRPLLLNLWLKAIESTDGIQYSQTGDADAACATPVA